MRGAVVTRAHKGAGRQERGSQATVAVSLRAAPLRVHEASNTQQASGCGGREG